MKFTTTSTIGHKLSVRNLPPGSTIDWGDGSSGGTTHTYTNGQVNTGTITFSQDADGIKPVRLWGDALASITEWGVNQIPWIRFNNSVYEDNIPSTGRSPNLTTVPNESPLGLNSLRMTFAQCSSLDCPLDNWEVSQVTTMFRVFWGCDSFNQNISSWDTSNVIDMGYAFYIARTIDHPLQLNVEGVESFENTFSHAYSYNNDIDDWYPESATNMFGMFNTAQQFNRDLFGWCVHNITEQPQDFDRNAINWTEPRPKWGCIEPTPTPTVTP